MGCTDSKIHVSDTDSILNDTEFKYYFEGDKHNKIFNIKHDKIPLKSFKPPIKFGYVLTVYRGNLFTIACKLPWDKKNYYKFRVKVRGVHCPDCHTNDFIERKYGYLACQLTVDYCIKQFVKLKHIEFDVGGRLIADVFIHNKKHDRIESLAEILISKKLAIYSLKNKMDLSIDWEYYYLNGVLKETDNESIHNYNQKYIDDLKNVSVISSSTQVLSNRQLNAGSFDSVRTGKSSEKSSRMFSRSPKNKKHIIDTNTIISSRD